MVLLGIFGFTFLVLLYSSFSWGYVASIFYLWFILPIFPTLPHFTVTQFVGFMIFISIFFRHSPDFFKDEYVDKTKQSVYYILSPWLTLLFGWLTYLAFFK